MASSHVYIMMVAWAIVLSGCLGEAEHSNPLDPHSPSFDSVGTISGVTTRFYPPYPALPEAAVTLSPGTYTVRSDEEGRFSFRNVPAGEYELSAEKPGFSSLTESVEVELGTSIDSVRVRLDGLPILQTVELTSIHVSRWFPTEDLYLVEAVVGLEDPDGQGDLDQVWLDIPAYGFSAPLEETSVMGRFAVSLSAEELPGESVFALQGDEFVVAASDEAGFVSRSDPQHILRVIDYTPVAIEPQGQAVVATPTPSLTWQDAALPYSYTYRIDVFRDQANVQTVAASVAEIPPDSLSHTLEMPLSSGTYFWTVSVVDEFGNRSRSKEAGFIIE